MGCGLAAVTAFPSLPFLSPPFLGEDKDSLPQCPLATPKVTSQLTGTVPWQSATMPHFTVCYSYSRDGVGVGDLGPLLVLQPPQSPW